MAKTQSVRQDQVPFQPGTKQEVADIFGHSNTRKSEVPKCGLCPPMKAILLQQQSQWAQTNLKEGISDKLLFRFVFLVVLGIQPRALHMTGQPLPLRCIPRP